MNNRELLISKIDEAIKECEIHIKRADYALLYIEPIFPITIKKYEELKKQEEDMMFEFKCSNNDYSKLEDMKTEYFDQFIYRYAKLQDKIAKSIIKSLVDLLEYNTETLSFIDCLNILEKHYIIDNANNWDKLRGVRNSIAHEYNDNIEYQVNMLNKVYDSYKSLLKIFGAIKKRFDDINCSL